ncbi:hypothetical protein T4B_9320 [Trichinella pseudospiralis]|uniref:Uncharacterized protein n=1 Tax=Trichinella pseudospiralis TaxID=6337 RepID=A0A0V1ED95_TRIPS|nr:hypothetical protein T4A_10070 [Trichinella pseudospiralis]KRZ30371.1 hypothetical protein T4B_9320 [Trichinella pseudospiralis]KRZ41086.1 hypothetical protein T4C_3174 [Trichinella pseudospiralis]
MSNIPEYPLWLWALASIRRKDLNLQTLAISKYKGNKTMKVGGKTLFSLTPAIDEQLNKETRC